MKLAETEIYAAGLHPGEVMHEDQMTATAIARDQHARTSPLSKPTLLSRRRPAPPTWRGVVAWSYMDLRAYVFRRLARKRPYDPARTEYVSSVIRHELVDFGISRRREVADAAKAARPPDKLTASARAYISEQTYSGERAQSFDYVPDPDDVQDLLECGENPSGAYNALIDAVDDNFLERKGKSPHPSIPAALVAPLASILSGRHGVKIVHEGAREYALYSGVTKVGLVVAETDAEAAAFVDALGTVAAHHVLRFVVCMEWVAALQGRPDPRRVVYSGGWSEFTKRLGLDSGSARDDVRRAASALHALSVVVDEKPQKILDLLSGGGGAHAYVSMTARGPLVHGYVHDLPRRGAKHRALVPLPVEVGTAVRNRQTHARELALEMLVLKHARMHLRESVEHETTAFGFLSVVTASHVFDLVEADVAKIARAVGFSIEDATSVLRGWFSPPGEGRSVLASSPTDPLPDTYAFQNDQPSLVEHLILGLTMTLEGRDRQRMKMVAQEGKRKERAKRRRKRAAK